MTFVIIFFMALKLSLEEAAVELITNPRYISGITGRSENNNDDFNEYPLGMVQWELRSEEIYLRYSNKLNNIKKTNFYGKDV